MTATTTAAAAAASRFCCGRMRFARLECLELLSRWRRGWSRRALFLQRGLEGQWLKDLLGLTLAKALDQIAQTGRDLARRMDLRLSNRSTAKRCLRGCGLARGQHLPADALGPQLQGRRSLRAGSLAETIT
jgi:hypothetical protein